VERRKFLCGTDLPQDVEDATDCKLLVETALGTDGRAVLGENSIDELTDGIDEFVVDRLLRQSA